MVTTVTTVTMITMVTYSFSFVCVQDLLFQAPAVLPSTARDETPPYFEVDAVVVFPNATLVYPSSSSCVAQNGARRVTVRETINKNLMTKWKSEL